MNILEAIKKNSKILITSIMTVVLVAGVMNLHLNYREYKESKSKMNAAIVTEINSYINTDTNIGLSMYGMISGDIIYHLEDILAEEGKYINDEVIDFTIPDITGRTIPYDGHDGFSIELKSVSYDYYVRLSKIAKLTSADYVIPYDIMITHNDYQLDKINLIYNTISYTILMIIFGGSLVYFNNKKY